MALKLKHPSFNILLTTSSNPDDWGCSKTCITLKSTQEGFTLTMGEHLEPSYESICTVCQRDVGNSHFSVWLAQ